ncbi:threonine synthase, partial [Neobacillus drentensis]|uniref:threonine synthase n=1 Tax=Neobacillus drentensis TaxID=220684 RepID=UPI00300243CC
ILELFHGPTFAFKDVALQFLGNLYSYISRKNNSIIHILGATSGDTGASAIEGVRGKEGIRICILHPHGKVSKVQELQMTTVDDANVLNLSVEGNFDDCQRIIKELFADVEFKHRYHLRAINSINIARILAQTVYYFYAYFQLAKQGHAGKVNFSVPTGNFGDIFAGYLPKRMGLPIHKLILATNENNILERFVREGVYQPGEFHITYSPSMDIQVASNFERYLYYLHGEDAQAVSAIMGQFKADGKIVIPADQLAAVQADFAAYGVQGDECLRTISKYHESYTYLLDPHTACGVAAAEQFTNEDEVTVALSTAHPAKFDEAIRLVNIEQT